MEDQILPPLIGEKLVSPQLLTPPQQELCSKMDDFHVQYGLRAKPSDMFCGALFVMKTEFRSNPDWMAQSANSLREILYPVWSRDVVAVSEKKDGAFKKFGSVRMSDELKNEIDRVYGFLNDITHHGCNPRFITDFAAFTPADFDILVADFEKIMILALERQVDVHGDVDEILAVDPAALIDNEGAERKNV